jgi:hypothetical protein
MYVESLSKRWQKEALKKGRLGSVEFRLDNHSLL